MTRRRSPHQDATAAILGPLDGARIPGGCDHCDAYQTVEPLSPGVWSLGIHHDDWCPLLAAICNDNRNTDQGGNT